LWLHLVAALLSLLGGLYLSYAIFLALEEQLGPPLAGVLTGAFFLLLAGFVLLWALVLSRRPRKSENTDVAEALVRVADLIGHKLDAPHASMAITAVLAGIVAGISPSARGFLLNLVEQLFKESKGEPK
jgi:hypothetical protein